MDEEKELRRDCCIVQKCGDGKFERLVVYRVIILVEIVRIEGQFLCLNVMCWVWCGELLRCKNGLYCKILIPMYDN